MLLFLKYVKLGINFTPPGGNVQRSGSDTWANSKNSRHFLPYGRHSLKQWLYLILNISSPNTHTILQIRKLRHRTNSSMAAMGMEPGLSPNYFPSNVPYRLTLQMWPALQEGGGCNLGTKEENANRTRALAKIYTLLKIYNFTKAPKA